MIVSEAGHIEIQNNHVGYHHRFAHMRQSPLTHEERDALMSVEQILDEALVFPSIMELGQDTTGMDDSAMHALEYLGYFSSSVCELCLARDLGHPSCPDASSLTMATSIYITEMHRQIRCLPEDPMVLKKIYTRTRGLHLGLDFFQSDGRIDWEQYCDLRLGAFLLPLDIIAINAKQEEQLRMQLLEHFFTTLLRAKALLYLDESTLVKAHLKKASRLAANIANRSFSAWSSNQIQSLHKALDA